MDIAYITRSRPHRKGAALLQTLQMVSAMQETGYRVRLYTPPWGGADAMAARLAELRRSNTPIDIRATLFLHHRWKRLNTYAPFIALNRRALKQADVLYTRFANISLALAKAGLRHTLELHHTFELVKRGTLSAIVDAHRRGIIEWLIPTMHTSAAFLIESGAIAERVYVAPNGVDTEAFSGLAPFDPGSLDRARIVYAGQLEAARGLDILRAIAESGEAQVTLVGKQKHQVTPGKGLAVRPRVPYKEVPALYGEADLIVLPYQRHLSYADSVCPLKIFEAMAAGRPIIASDIPTIRELVRHNETALLVDPDDTSAWVDAVRLLKNDPALAGRLARAVRELAQQFTWRRRVENIARALGWPVAGNRREAVLDSGNLDPIKSSQESISK